MFCCQLGVNSCALVPFARAKPVEPLQLHQGGGGGCWEEEEDRKSGRNYYRRRKESEQERSLLLVAKPAAGPPVRKRPAVFAVCCDLCLIVCRSWPWAPGWGVSCVRQVKSPTGMKEGPDAAYLWTVNQVSFLHPHLWEQLGVHIYKYMSNWFNGFHVWGGWIKGFSLDWSVGEKRRRREKKQVIIV